MLEKFTENALSSVIIAQNEAKKMQHLKVFPEHILLGIIVQSTGLAAKLFKMTGINSENLSPIIRRLLKSIETSNSNSNSNIGFHHSTKELFEKAKKISLDLQSSCISSEHILIALIELNTKNLNEIFSLYDIDKEESKITLLRLIANKLIKNTSSHPEENRRKSDRKENLGFVDNLFNEPFLNDILKETTSKISTTEYEIIGFEEIMQSILKKGELEVSGILNKFGLDFDNFSGELAKKEQDESLKEKQKQIILTPDTVKTMIVASELSKEFGNAHIMPEHLLLGLMKYKNGVSFEILRDLNIDLNLLEQDILSSLENQKSEILTILKIAKEEAVVLKKDIVGTEMILLGILEEGKSIASKVLVDLGINLNDTKIAIKKLLGNSILPKDENKEISYSPRAKKVLEEAWLIAKEQKRSTVLPEDLLSAIILDTTSVAIKVLHYLGVDSFEIKQGILKYK